MHGGARAREGYSRRGGKRSRREAMHMNERRGRSQQASGESGEDEEVRGYRGRERGRKWWSNAEAGAGHGVGVRA
eukprot:4805844-Pleurochrysis_carterae.AAC.1